MSLNSPYREEKLKSQLINEKNKTNTITENFHKLIKGKYLLIINNP